ncbi:hypothetical protein ONA24_06930 [Mycoplasmopsis cynos]|nr:hypothetical protein [Mycoplasmopsis cynos]WAM09662.1 hypothetical protein ONA24_06930 [Mycoplasmopsis cynos]
MATTHLNITIPSGIFFEGDVEIVTLRSSTGYIGLQYLIALHYFLALILVF